MRHLISVAGGLDSLVIGEPQILGQLKQAWQAARNAGTANSVLDRMFQHAFGAAKRIRANSDIGGHPVSVAYTTVVLARQIFNDLSRRTVVLIGAGDMIRLCAQHLAHGKNDSEGAASMIIVNRNLQHAQDLAAELSGHNNIEVCSLDNLEVVLPQADILITSTSSPDTLIGPDMVKAALQQRRHRPMFMVDIAVPRDIDPAISVLDGIYLYTIDDLQQVVDENLAQRGAAAKNAMPTVEEDARSFMRWVNGSRAAQTIENVRKAAAEHAVELKTRALRQLAAGQDAEAVLSQLTHTLTNKILHQPSTNVRQAAEAKDFKILEAAERIFGEIRAEPKDDHNSPNSEETEE